MGDAAMSEWLTGWFLDRSREHPLAAARRYRVLNRNVWWNRRFVAIAASSDSEAVEALLAMRAEDANG